MCIYIRKYDIKDENADRAPTNGVSCVHILSLQRVTQALGVGSPDAVLVGLALLHLHVTEGGGAALHLPHPEPGLLPGRTTLDHEAADLLAPVVLGGLPLHGDAPARPLWELHLALRGLGAVWGHTHTTTLGETMWEVCVRGREIQREMYTQTNRDTEREIQRETHTQSHSRTTLTQMERGSNCWF